VEKTNYPVAVMCRVLAVSGTGFHNRMRRPPSDRALSDAWLTEKIRQIHDRSRGVYGAPGSQYVSLAFGRAAHEAGIAVSMGSRGDAYDNAERAARAARARRLRLAHPTAFPRRGSRIPVRPVDRLRSSTKAGHSPRPGSHLLLSERLLVVLEPGGQNRKPTAREPQSCLYDDGITRS
jgi:transposase InsO family protein